MKLAAILALTELFLVRPLVGQGTVMFNNTSTTLITTNSGGAVGPMSGLGNFRIGLYAGPFGSSESSLTLAGLTTNSVIPGRFSGGTPFTFPTVPGLFDGSVTITFQIRVWSSTAGLSYENAASDPTALSGVSALGMVTPNPPGSIYPPSGLFSFNPLGGQVGGFVLTAHDLGNASSVPSVPEPGVYSLTAIAALFFARFYRRR